MKTVIEMAREANFFMPQGESFYQAWPEEIERFAELVRADERNRTWTQDHWTEYERSIAAQEREACAKVCEERLGPTATDFYGKTYAAAIRARSNT